MVNIDNTQIEWQPAMTLGQAMALLADADMYAVVRLNGKLVCRPNFSNTLVHSGDVVETIPLIAGG